MAMVPCSGGPLAAREVKLARHPDYHEGKIAFSYLGDIWVVREDGSAPQRLTVHSARDIHPRFSPDGKCIAFSSARHGNYDVFVMPAGGGEARRLSYHSANDYVVGWSRDSRRVIFSSARGRPYPGIPALYEVGVDGGPETSLPTDWGSYGSYSPDGKKLAFNRHPMVWSRKHYRGSYAADLWVADLEHLSFRKILDQDTPDEKKPNNFWPMYGNGEIYFVSDRETVAKAGTGQVMTSVNNIWKVREDGSEPQQLTHHTSGSLFYPSLSSDGQAIVYEEGFGLWKLDLASGQTHEVKIDIACDEKENLHETLTVNDEADSFHLSPSAKRAVATVHGELFSIPTDKGEVRRITETPGARETDPRWSPDGKWIAFVSDRSGRDEVWLCDERGGGLKKVSDGESQKGQIAWAPDSKALAYVASDRKLYKYGLEDGKTMVLASGEVVGFGGGAVNQPQFAPDGKWIAYIKARENLLPHVYIVPATGGPERRLTDEDSFSETAALWTPDGKGIVYLSGADVSNISPQGPSSAQIYVIALAPRDKDPFDKGIDSEEQAVAADRDERGRRPAGGRAEGREEDGEAPRGGPAARERKVEVKIDWQGLGRRGRQLTRTADSVTGLAVSLDSKTVTFSTTGTEGGRPVQSLWSMGIDGERLTRLAQAGRPTEEDGPPRGGFRGFGGFTSLQFAKDGRSLYYRQGNNIYAVAVPSAPRGGEGGESAAAGGSPSGSPATGGASSFGRGGAGGGSTPRRLSFTARVQVDHRAEHRQVFEESWRVMKHRFYDPRMHGVNWDQMKQQYEPLLAHVADQEELHNVVSMMIGELNASHTGISGGGREGREAGEQTRFPGLELEPDASGFYKVAHVYKRGPADKDYVKIKAGDFILAVDGHDLTTRDNYWKNFNEAPSAKMEFTVNSKPAKEGAWKVGVRPVSSFQLGTLQYDKWVDERREMVRKLAGDEIGYLHIRQMSEPALRKFERDLAELYDKKALVIDQRFNPGGNIDQELLAILQQKQYQYTRVRDSIQIRRPFRAFFGPMVVLANERSTSDAEVFPDGFRTLKLGKIVGVTTYGAVIGTGAYSLMDGSVIRTPGSGLWNVSGTNLENYGVPPDIYVDNTPEDYLKGRDAQLEKAVEVLRQSLTARK
jgi:tricorn protease